MIAKSRADLEAEVLRYRDKALAEHKLMRFWQNRAVVAEARLLAIGATVTPTGHPESERGQEP